MAGPFTTDVQSTLVHLGVVWRVNPLHFRPLSRAFSTSLCPPLFLFAASIPCFGNSVSAPSTHHSTYICLNSQTSALDKRSVFELLAAPLKASASLSRRQALTRVSTQLSPAVASHRLSVHTWIGAVLLRSQLYLWGSPFFFFFCVPQLYLWGSPFFFFFCVPQLYFWGSPYWVRFLRM